MGWMGTIVILASCEHYFIRVHENLVQHPINDIWIAILYLCVGDNFNRVDQNLETNAWKQGVHSFPHRYGKVNNHFCKYIIKFLFIIRIKFTYKYDKIQK